MANARTSEPVERSLPVNVDAERFVLGSIFLDDALFVQAAATLKVDDFSLQKHRLIFRRMGELQSRGEHIDRVTTANELMKFNELEACDGLSYLTSLDDGLPHIPNIDAYIRIVKDKAELRHIIFASQHTMNRALLGEEDPSVIAAGAREVFLQVGVSQNDDGPQTPSQIIEALPGGINEFLGPPKQGLHTGFDKYDEMTGGMHPGEYIVIAARPSMGKTALLLNIARHVTVKLGKTAMVFSLEMSKHQLLHRLVCAEARVDSHRVRLGFLNHEERSRLASATQRIMDAKLLIDDKSAATTADMHARIRRQMSIGKVDFVAADYLQLMSAGRTYENKNQEVTAISRGIKLLASEIGAPVVVLSQLSRDPEKRKGNNRPMLADLRESGSIEQDADTVGFIFREEVYNKDREDLRGLAELILAKQRNGPIGTINLIFLHSLTKFESRAEDCGEPDDAPPPLLEGEYGR